MQTQTNQKKGGNGLQYNFDLNTIPPVREGNADAASSALDVQVETEQATPVRAAPAEKEQEQPVENEQEQSAGKEQEPTVEQEQSAEAEVAPGNENELEKILSDLDSMASQQLYGTGTSAQPVQATPVQAAPAWAQPAPAGEMQATPVQAAPAGLSPQATPAGGDTGAALRTALQLEIPQIRFTQEEYEEAMGSPAGLANHDARVVQAVLGAIEKPLRHIVENIIPVAAQNVMQNTIRTLEPVIDNRVRTQAVITEWWTRNPDLLGVRNLVGVAANRIAAGNPNISLEELLEKSGAEVRRIVNAIRNKAGTNVQQTNSKASFASVKGGGRAASKTEPSILAQLGFK